MSPRRRLLLWGSLALTLAATAWIYQEDNTDAGKRPSRQVTRRPLPAAPSGALPSSAPLGLSRGQYSDSHADLFPGRDWTPPAPPPGTAPPPGPPPLPFTYIGKQDTAQGSVLFLLYQERTLAVRRGDVIDDTYRLEKITPQNAVLVYLPSKQQQSLDLGSAKQ